MPAYLQTEANSLKAKLNVYIEKMLISKHLKTFSYRLCWQNNDSLIITLEYYNPIVNRLLKVEFDVDLTIVFNGQPDDCCYIDKDAGVEGVPFNRVNKALTRVLFIMFLGCTSIEKDLDHWKNDDGLKSVSFQINRHGSILHYFRY